MAVTKVINSQPDYNSNVSSTTPQTPPIQAKPVWMVPDGITNYVDANPFSTAANAVLDIGTSARLSAKPFLAPPSKDLEEKAAQAVQVFTTFAISDHAKLPSQEKEQPRGEEEESLFTTSELSAEILREEEETEQALKEKRHRELHEKGLFTEAYETDEDDLLNLNARRKKLFHKTTGKSKEEEKELTAKVSKQSTEAEDDLAKGEKDEHPRNLFPSSFNPDRDVLKGLYEQRELLKNHAALSFKEVSFSQRYRQQLKKEIDQLCESIEKRSKTSKILNWIGQGTNICAGASSIVIAAVTIATGGLGAFLAVIPAALKAVGTATQLGSGIVKMTHQTDQANLFERQESRELAHTKIHDLLMDTQKANKTLHTLWKTSSDILKKMAKATSEVYHA
ncbi:MAG: hypothetical protein ACSNEK_01575 [Parachlamydiaceae bacterium]